MNLFATAISANRLALPLATCSSNGSLLSLLHLMADEEHTYSISFALEATGSCVTIRF